MVYTGQTFDGVDVELDGNRFENCILTNCKFIYRGGQLPDFIGNKMDSCNFKLEGAAKQTILFGRWLGAMNLPDVVEAIIGEFRKPLC